MKNFETRKQEYLNKLKENEELIERLIGSNNTPISEQNVKTILSPNNEKELNVAEITFTIFKDTNDLLDAIKEGRIKELPFEDNEALNIIISIMKDIKTTGTVDKEKYTKIVEEKVGKILYGYMIASLTDGSGMLDYVANSVGYDLDDQVDFVKFTCDFILAKQVLNVEKETNFGTIDNVTKRDIEDMKMFSEQFHEVCKEGIIEPSQKIYEI